MNAVEKRQIDLVGYLHKFALGVVPLKFHAHADVVEKPVAFEVYIAKELEPDAEIAEVGLDFLVAIEERDLVGGGIQLIDELQFLCQLEQLKVAQRDFYIAL